MENDYKDSSPGQTDDDTNWEALFTDDDAQQWEKEKAKRKRRKSLIVKIISSFLVLSLLISGLGMWFDVFNIPAIQFMEASNKLSKQPEVREYKKAIVTIKWNGVKGTGFIISKDGLIVTNNHVVENTKRVNVYAQTGETYVGTVIAKHPEHDLAIVDIKAVGLHALPLIDEKNWDQWVGEKIIFIGNPLAYTQIANQGTITGKVLLQDWDIPVMMIEAPIYRGNSGSPVINDDGKVVGVVFATLQNPDIKTKKIIGAAIPAFYIKTLLDEVKK